MKSFRFIWCMLSAVLCLTGGCIFHAHHADPLAAWNLAMAREPSPAITKDYQDYIAKLPPDERRVADMIQSFEDGTGKQAITIIVGLKGTWWRHILIYDCTNVRIKVITYAASRYWS